MSLLLQEARFTPSQLANCMWALASLRWLPGPRWLAAFCAALRDALHRMSPGEVAMVAWSLSAIRCVGVYCVHVLADSLMRLMGCLATERVIVVGCVLGKAVAKSGDCSLLPLPPPITLTGSGPQQVCWQPWQRPRPWLRPGLTRGSCPWCWLPARG
jgi:hypothetical protein